MPTPRTEQAAPAWPRPHIPRKKLNVDQDKLDRVVELLGASSETEAIDRALDEILFREELVAGIDRIAGTGGVENFFDEPVEA